MASKKLAEKVAIVTGGGSGIGQSIAIRFAREGAQVVIFELSQDHATETVDRIASFGGQVQVYACDVSDHQRVRDTVRAVAEAYSRIDILINNAGIGHVGKLEDTTEADMDRLYQVNVKGIYNGMHACIGPMVAQGGGVILNLASIVSKIGILDRFAYSMSKGAVLTMTLSVARDYIDQNIRCNCICPARIHTPFVDDYLARNYPGEEEAMFRHLSAFQPIGRMGTPDEIANLALFLCSEDAAFITGSAYDIDGGSINLR